MAPTDICGSQWASALRGRARGRLLGGSSPWGRSDGLNRAKHFARPFWRISTLVAFTSLQGCVGPLVENALFTDRFKPPEGPRPCRPLFYETAQSRADRMQALAGTSMEARTHFERGFFESEQCRWAEAIAQYTQALEIDPHLAPAYNERGIAQLEIGNLTRAITDFDQALVLNPRYAIAFLYRGNARARQSDWTEAMADFTKALKLDPRLEPALHPPWPRPRAPGRPGRGRGGLYQSPGAQRP